MVFDDEAFNLSEEIQPTLLALSSLLKVLKVPKVSKCWTLLAGRSPSLSTLLKRIKGTLTLSKGTKALNKSDSINCKSFKKVTKVINSKIILILIFMYIKHMNGVLHKQQYYHHHQ